MISINKIAIGVSIIIILAVSGAFVSHLPSRPTNPLIPPSASTSTNITVSDSVLQNENGNKSLGVKKDALIDAMKQFSFEQVSSTGSSIIRMQSSDKDSDVIFTGKGNDLSKIDFQSSYILENKNTQISPLLDKSAKIVEEIIGVVDSQATDKAKSILSSEVTSVSQNGEKQVSQNYTVNNRTYTISVMKEPTASIILSIF